MARIDIQPAFLKLQAKREKRMTMEDLAQETGISIAALYRLKHAAEIKLATLEKLCLTLECTPSELIVITKVKK